MFRLGCIILFFLIGFGIGASPTGIDTLKEAKKAYSGRQFQKAVKLFQEYSKLNPKDGEPFMYLGYIYESLREYNISTAYFRKAIDLKLNPKQKSTVLLKLIIFFNYLKAWNYVVHYSNQYLQLDPGNQEVEKILARARGFKGTDQVTSVTLQAQEKEKDKDKETKKSEKNKEGDKISKESDNARVQTAKEKKDSNEADELYRDVLKDIDRGDFLKADLKVQKLLERFPNNKIYVFKAGYIQLKLKDPVKALSYFDQIIKYINEGEDPFNYQFYLYRGIALANLEKYDLALDSFRKAFASGNSFTPLLLISKIKYENGDFEDVLRYSNYIHNLDPDNLEAIMYRAVSKLQLGLKNDGFKDLLLFSKKIRSQYPNLKDSPEKYNIGFHYLGIYYSGRKKYKLALKYLSHSQKNYLSSYTFAVGKSLFYTKNYTQSQTELEKLQEIPAANFLISKIYIINNNLDKCKEYLLRATKKKEFYWSRTLTDSFYKPVISINQEFSSFINNKGVVPPPVPKPPLPPSESKPVNPQ